jgi:hypothetical protein
MAHPAKQTEALLWLLDHAGRYVTVSIELDVGSHSEPVVSQQGILEHWTDDRPGELTDAIIAATGTGLSGWYKVEKLSLDLTRVDNAVALFEIKSGVVKNAPVAALAAAHGESQGSYEELVVTLDPRVTLRVTMTMTPEQAATAFVGGGSDGPSSDRPNRPRARTVRAH